MDESNLKNAKEEVVKKSACEIVDLKRENIHLKQLITIAKQEHKRLKKEISQYANP